MPRPQKIRFVTQTPTTTYYKPRGIPLATLQEAILSVDELEALRLADYLDLRQQEVAKRLKVSQPTLNRILRSAHYKIADVLVNGKALRIHGGSYELPDQRWFECFSCHHHWVEPFGTGRPRQCPQCQSLAIHRLAQKPNQTTQKVEPKMKICVTAQGSNLDAPLDPRFGRCAQFIFVDSDTLKFEVAPNPAATAGGGAGIQAAQLVADRHATVVLTGHLGPNAYQALTASGIQVFTGLVGTVREAVEQFRAGRLTQVSGPTAPAHAGIGRGGGRGLGRGGGGGGRGRWTQ